MIPRRWAHSDPGEWAEMRRWMQEDPSSGAAHVDAWERRFADYVGRSQAAAVNSGRQGLRLVFDHFQVGEGDEVIVPAYTLGELMGPLQAMGIRLVPADIDPRTFNLTRQSVAQRITERTKLILAVHLFGTPCDIEGIVELGASRGIPVIEDCAHALGARLGERPLGGFGAAAFFSLETTKLINTYGGGMIVSDIPELIEEARAFNASEPKGCESLAKKMRGIQMEQWMFRTRLIFPILLLLALPQGQPLVNRLYRGTQHRQRAREAYAPAQARLGLRKIETLEARLETRRQRAALMRSLLKSDIQPQHIPEGASPAYFFFVALLPRDAVGARRHLLLKGIDAGVGNEVMDDCAALLGYDDCLHARDVFNRAMTLPMFDGMTEGDCERIAKALNAVT